MSRNYYNPNKSRFQIRNFAFPSHKVMLVVQFRAVDQYIVGLFCRDFKLWRREYACEGGLARFRPALTWSFGDDMNRNQCAVRSTILKLILDICLFAKLPTTFVVGIS
jgi:hypothetical protein